MGQSKEMTSTKDSSDNSTKSRLTEEQKQQVRFWIRTMGCDLAACYSQEKNIYKERWGDNIINEIDYDTRLEQGWYNDGVAVICGQLRHGSYKAKWITCLDFDSKDAFDKFCEILGTNLEKLAKWTRVEWHNSLESMHVFLISNKPFKNLAETGIEVKANKLLAFVSPSLHKSGEEYRAFDGESIAILDSIDQLRTESIIDIFIKTCTDDQRSYFDEDAKQKYIEYLNAEGTILRAGERHPGTIANGTSMFFKHKGEWRDLSDPQRFEKLVAWHKRVCDPPLFDVPDRENEVQEIWDDICKKYTGKRQQERDAREDDEAIKGEVKKNAPRLCGRKQSVLEGFNETIRLGLAADIWTMVSEIPPKFIVAKRNKGHICRMTVSYTDSDNDNVATKKTHLNYGSIIIRLFPKHITLRENPLKFLESPPEYTIVFEDQDGKEFAATGSIEEIVAHLKEKPGYIVSTYGVAEALTAIIGAFKDDGTLIVDKSVDFEGFYFHDGDIHISKIDFDKKHPVRTIEECLSCIEYLEERAKFQIWDYKGRKIDRRNLLASAIQWTIAAPFNFAIKQITNKKYYQKAFDMTGERDGGKSGLSQEMLNIHGNHTDQKEVDSIYSLATGSMNTEAKFGKGVSKTTYPIEISEFGTVESYGRNENLVEIVKTAVEGLIVRRGKDGGRYDAPFASCSPFILNGNPFISKKGEIIKRLHVAKFSEEDRHDRSPTSPFNKFQDNNGYKIKILGDWTIRYILENKHELLLSGKYTVYDLAKKAIYEFYQFTGKEEVPEWLTRWIVDTALEELDVDDESIIRSILYDNVHKTLASNSRLIELDNREVKVNNYGNEYLAPKISPITLSKKISLCIDNELWSWLRKKKLQLGETEQKYYIEASILELFSRRLPNLGIKKLGEKTGLKYSQE